MGIRNSINIKLNHQIKFIFYIRRRSLTIKVFKLQIKIRLTAN